MQSLVSELEASEVTLPRIDGDPTSRRLLVLLHGEKANDELVREAVSRLRKEGHQVTVRVTFEAGDVDRLVKEALVLRSVDTLVAAGGDGTICEVVDALLKHTGGVRDTRSVTAAEEPLVRAQGNPPGLDALSVAILPLGTSNDFAATTGIPEDPYEALLLATKRSAMHRIDVGLLNGKVFMNTATIGASADVSKVTSSRLKRMMGPLAFLLTGMRVMSRWRPVPSVLCFPNIKEHGAYLEQKQKPDPEGTPLYRSLSEETPAEGAVTFEPGKAPDSPVPPAYSRASSMAKTAAEETGTGVGELEGVPLLHLTAANNRQIASMLSVSPDAVLDDGMLDCIYLTGTPMEQARRMLTDLVLKGWARTKVSSTLLRVPWLEVATEHPLDWSLDGDSSFEPTTHFRFSLLHRAVQVHLPDDRMLVAGQPDPKPQDASLAATRKLRHGRSNPLRLPRGRLRPPSLHKMINSVVRFRKKKNWGAMLRSGFFTLMRTLVVASAGGAAVHLWHKRRAELEANPEQNSSKERKLRRKQEKLDEKQRKLEAKQRKQEEKQRKQELQAAGQGV